MTVPIVKSRSFSNVSPASDVELGEGYRHESRSGEQAIPDHGQSVVLRRSWGPIRTLVHDPLSHWPGTVTRRASRPSKDG